MLDLLERCALCGARWTMMTFPGVTLGRPQPCLCEPTGERHRYFYPLPQRPNDGDGYLKKEGKDG
jgi:hypothetical protein